jgi:carotenoid 1,2-hydratase
VFSPYYAWARAHGKGDPINHCAVNVALYGRDRKRWAMTERGRGHVGRASSSLAIGPSLLTWDGDTLTIRIDEVTAPAPTRIRGVVRVYPKALTSRAFALDPAGRHRWWPIAPSAHVEVTLEQPALRWSGDGYLDSNTGEVPLEADFQSWIWSRTSLARSTAVLYDVVSLDCVDRSFALRFDPSGQVEEFAPPAPVRLPPTLWRIARTTRADDARSTTVVKTLEDAPFYARSLLSTRLLGQSRPAIHESLSLQRFRARWVQALLPFRMPRAWRR